MSLRQLPNEALKPVLDFVASIQAHALIECGMEPHINRYDEATILRIAAQMPEHLGAHLRRAWKGRA